ncbi:MAG: DUF4331 family protein [Parasphingorhabdus sp.]|nr:DUF4331 family protein [Parasphingorhabdus sp.]
MFSKTRKTLALSSPLVLAMLLSSCGGDNSPTPTPAPAPAPAPTPTPGPPPPGPPPKLTFNVQPCLDQVIPGTGGVTVAGAIVPDTLTLNLAAASGFPNGRRLADPVIDVTLAVIFLDLTKHSPLFFANLPLNPPGNDVPVLQGFPYLAPPQGTPPLSGTSGANFNFNNASEASFVRVDRMGMPAVSTALIGSARKTAYNDANPSDDAAATFVPDLRDSLANLTSALADDITGLGLSTCAVQNP